MWAGMVFRESSTGKFVTAQIEPDGTTPPLVVGTEKWADAVSFPTNYFRTEALLCAPDWWQINDDGTNLKFRMSRDGHGWTEFFTKSRTDYLAGGPNQFGFFVSAYNVPATPYWLTGAHLLSMVVS